MEAKQENPFAFGIFVSGEQFYDRAEIRLDLLRYISSPPISMKSHSAVERMKEYAKMSKSLDDGLQK